MFKRTAVLFGFFTFLALFTVFAVFRLSVGDGLAEAAAKQQTYTLTVSASRGTIYDRNLDPMTGIGEKEYPAAIVPSGEVAAELSRSCPAALMRSIQTLISKGRPFTMNLPTAVSAPGIDVFPQNSRYTSGCPAAHIIGYLDGSGKGAAGIEKIFDEYLSTGQGKITVSYQTDALGHILSGSGKTVSDKSTQRKRGVVLTIDRSIQQLAEESVSRYLKKGAAVVLDVPSGKILALASLPSYDQNHVAAVLKSADSPLLNRATSAYNLGSVFKLVAAATALDDGISPDTSFTCAGSVDVDGQAFHCYDGEKHGTENMKQAIANSCNTYFVQLMQKVPQKDFYQMAKLLGFGSACEIAPGMTATAGTLPELGSLNVPRALANFSFGQGELTATPLQVAAMVNAIASGGIYTKPYLYVGKVDENLRCVDTAQPQQGVRAMSEQTAALLREFMKASADAGTGQKGRPDYGSAGVKTATAQTGRFVDGVELNDCWLAGFYPYENPKFVIVVFSEGGNSGGAVCGPVFREIANGLYGYVS
jgi:penicillin-binding protein 2